MAGRLRRFFYPFHHFYGQYRKAQQVGCREYISALLGDPLE